MSNGTGSKEFCDRIRMNSGVLLDLGTYECYE